MAIIADFYLNHFDQYGCKFYRSSTTDISDLDDRDSEWLTKIGLPDGAIPFFFFDFYIGLLRDLDLPGCKFVLGTAFEPASRHYIYIDQYDQVVIQMENNTHLFVNSSVHQLCACIYEYSCWLEDQEEKFALSSSHVVDEDEMFDLYCRLRDIDRQAFTEDASIWPQLVNSEVRFMEDVGKI